MAAFVSLTPVVPAGGAVVVGRTGDIATCTYGGGWSETGRPRRTSLTEWDGWPLAQLTIPFIVDAFATMDSVEPTIAALEALIRDLRGGSQPSVVVVDGPIPGTNLRWVLQSIDHGEEIRRPGDGARVRLIGTLHLLEYNEIELLVSTVPTPAAAAVERATPAPTTGGTATAPAPASGRSYTVRSGDTLGRIAQQQLGNAGRWPEIAKLNSIRDPRSLRVGQVIRLP